MAGAARGAAEVADSDCDRDPEVAFSRASVTRDCCSGWGSWLYLLSVAVLCFLWLCSARRFVHGL